jgi:hypothetical protein
MSCSGCFTLGKDWVPIVQEAGWGPGLVWMCVENFYLTASQTLQPIAVGHTDHDVLVLMLVYSILPHAVRLWLAAWEWL